MISSRIQRRQQRNVDKLELLKKARELGNKFSEKIAQQQRSKKVQHKEFEYASSPENQYRDIVFN